MLTQNIKEGADKYRELKEDKSTFLGQLNCFLNALYLHSANILGTEELAGIGIFSRAQSFYSYYHNLDTKQKNAIPQTLVDELTLLQQYFSGEKKADIDSCFATRHNEIKKAMSGHETCLASLGLSDNKKNLMISQTKETFEQGLKQLETTLNAKTNGYEGKDKLGVSRGVLDKLQLNFQFSAFENANQLIHHLNAEDIPTLFQNQQTQDSFFQTINTIENIAALILEISNQNLNALFRALDKNRLSGILMEDMDVFCNFYKLLDEDKKNTLLSCVNIDYKDRHNYSALIYAAWEGHTEIALALIEKGARLDVREAYGDTALICAAWEGHTEIALALIEKGASLDVSNRHANTAMILAAKNGHKEIALALIKKGARLDVRDIYGNTAFIWTIVKGHTEIALALIEKVESVDAQKVDGTPLLTWAVKKGQTKLALALIGKGASLDAQDAYGRTALIWAAKNKHKDIALALIEKGAGLDVRNNDGSTAMIWAARMGHTEIALTLIVKGASLVV